MALLSYLDSQWRDPVHCHTPIPSPLLLHYRRVSGDESVNSKDGASLYIHGILEFGGGFLHGKSSHLSTTFPVSRCHWPSSGSPPPKGHLYTPSGGENMGRMGTVLQSDIIQPSSLLAFFFVRKMNDSLHPPSMTVKNYTHFPWSSCTAICFVWPMFSLHCIAIMNMVCLQLLLH